MRRVGSTVLAFISATSILGCCTPAERQLNDWLAEFGMQSSLSSDVALGSIVEKVDGRTIEVMGPSAIMDLAGMSVSNISSFSVTLWDGAASVHSEIDVGLGLTFSCPDDQVAPLILGQRASARLANEILSLGARTASFSAENVQLKRLDILQILTRLEKFTPFTESGDLSWKLALMAKNADRWALVSDVLDCSTYRLGCVTKEDLTEGDIDRLQQFFARSDLGGVCELSVSRGTPPETFVLRLTARGGRRLPLAFRATPLSNPTIAGVLERLFFEKRVAKVVRVGEE